MKDINGKQIMIDFPVGAPLAAPGNNDIKDDSQGAASSAPTGDMTDIETRVISLIQRGRENAISMPALADACGISTRELQSIIQHLINDHGILIASATGKGKGDTKRHGYYYPVTEEELLSARTQIIHRIISLAKRLKSIDRQAYEKIFGQENIFDAKETE